MGTSLARYRRVVDRDVLTWNLMIGASVQHGQGQEALELFKQMQCQSVLPDNVTLVSLLSACSKLSALAQGVFMHALIRCTEWDPDVVIGTALVTMYGKCGSIKDASKTFDMMPSRNVVTWNAIITSSIRHGDVHQACRLFDRMQADAVHPNRITFLTIIDACTSRLELDEGKRVHDYMVRNGSDADVVLATSLVNMYGKSNHVADARRIFDMIPDRDVVLWSSMIAVSCQGHGKEAQRLFEQMKQEGTLPDTVTFVSVLDACAVQADIVEGKKVHAIIPHMGVELDVILVTSLMNMYGKCSSMDNARNMFDTILQPSVVSWNALLAAYAHLGNSEEACQVFNNMQQEGAIPSHVTFASIIDSCAGHAMLKEGKRIHTLLMSSGLEGDVIVETALVNMYGKCGSLENAYGIFNKMEEQNAVTWTAIISAFAQHGNGWKALQLFNQMQQVGVRPDTVTFLSILSACRHAGLVNQAYHWLNIMVQDYGISPSEKDYECLIDSLGKAGRLDEAEELINQMPYVPTTVTWTALLGSCRDQIDVVRGERAANCMFKMNAKESAPYVTLSSIYSAAGRNDDAEKLMLRMKGRKDVEAESEALVLPASLMVVS